MAPRPSQEGSPSLGTLGSSWDDPREVPARPWSGLGPSLGRLGVSPGILGASRERLGTSWGRLGSDSKKNLVLLTDVCSQLWSPELHFSSPRCRESTIEQKIAFRNRHRFLIDFGANLRPFSIQKLSKIASKTDLERHRFFDRFLHRFFLGFGCILGANLELCWGHVGSENRPRAAQHAFQDACGSQNPPRAPKWLQNGAPDAPKWCPRRFILDGFWW